MQIGIKAMMKGNNLIVFTILCIAAILRFYNFFDIPYTFDELSALNRTTYDSFSELIDKGILNDGHPALIQVFLYCWVRIFSYSEYIVKLPFLICGLISVWLVFAIGKKWFNETTGLLSATFIATLQFTIMYSQIARPYATGLCFILLFVYFWTTLVIEKKNNILFWILFSISAALCAYNHYFSMFSAMLLAIAGLFFVSRKQRLKYLLFNVISAILFLPHLKITLHQLSLGGLNWLPVPDETFFAQYFGFVFHYSNYLILFFIGLIVLGIVLRFIKSFIFPSRGLFLLSILLFTVPLLTGYFYSIYGKPVLQFSVLIFSIPFLFFFVFSFFPPLKFRANVVLVVIIGGFTISTLVFSRQYFRFFYNQGYDSVARNQIALTDSLKQPVALLINGYEPLFLQYYAFKYNHEIPCNLYVFDSYSNTQFLNYLKELKSYDYLAIVHVGGMPLQFLDLAKEEFPYFVKKEAGSGFEWYVYSKIKQKDSKEFYRDFSNSFDKSAFFWNVNTANICKKPNDSVTLCYKFNESEEWGPDFKATLEDMSCGKHDLIHVSAEVLTEDEEASLVFTLQNAEDSVINWQGVNVKDFPMGADQWRRIYLVVRLTDNKIENDTITMHTYLWNKGKKPLYLENFKVRLEKGNPFIYSMFYDY